MTAPTLVVMAAGMGSRYGGLKQIDPVGPSGETILEYSVFDAIEAGFGRIVFIIKEEMREAFEQRVGKQIPNTIQTGYVYQKLEDIPEGFSVPDGRTKPWGTAQAIYCCRKDLSGPFAVINADDFYGKEAFVKVARFLNEAADGEKLHTCMVGYTIENTLTDYGAVTRGICVMSGEGYLESIKERKRLERIDGKILDTDENGSSVVAPGTLVSMNIWGFTKPLSDELEQYLSSFLLENRGNLEKEECYLPLFVGALIKEGKTKVKVLKTSAKWFGVTYKEDRPAVQKAIRDLAGAGIYPESLWGV